MRSGVWSFMLLDALVATLPAEAEEVFGFCSGVVTRGDVNSEYLSQPTTLGTGTEAELVDAAASFRRYVRASYPGYDSDLEGSWRCQVAGYGYKPRTLAEAQQEESEQYNHDVNGYSSPIIQTYWRYKPIVRSKQGTHTGGAKPTEAEALYDAENFPGPFEDNQYKTIHSWDTHDCTTKQVTGVAGSSKPTTFYQCTVTFSYSDTASPVAKTAFGKGDTQDAAIAAAKFSTVGVTWGQPFCSAFTVTVKNKYKADYGHSSGTKQQAWACEIDYTATK